MANTLVFTIPISLMEIVTRMNANEEPNTASITRITIILDGGVAERVAFSSNTSINGRK